MKKNLQFKHILSLAVMILLFVGGLSAQQNLPYSYGFENNNLATEGWTMNNTVTYSTGIKSISSNTHAGSYYFSFYSSKTINPQYLISPELVSSDAGVYVKLYYRCGSSREMSFYVGYSTSDTDINTHFTWSNVITTSSTTYDYTIVSFPVSDIKYIAIKYDYNSGDGYNMFFDDICVTDYSYIVPQDINTSSLVTSANISWTPGNAETDWLLYYSKSATDPAESLTETSDYLKAVTGKPSYSLSGLDENTTYYVWVRSNYGSNNYSTWIGPISFTPSTNITVNESGANSNYSIPFNYNMNNLNKSQFIIPATDLTDMVGMKITKLTFYTNTANKTWGDATFKVYMTEVENPTFSKNEFNTWGDMTEVFNGTSSFSTDANKLMVIELTTPFDYTGGNLLIGFNQQNTVANSSSLGWYGVNDSNTSKKCSLYGTTSVNSSYWLPKITFKLEYQDTYDTDGNWPTSGAPAATDNVLVQGNITIANGTNATANVIDIDAGSLTIANGATLTCNDINTIGGSVTIADGGQLICNNSVAATVQKTTKEFTATAKEEEVHNWYAISSPVANVAIASFVPADPAENWNVYQYDEGSHFWEEYRDPANKYSNLENGRGYLYRSTVANIAFSGNTNVTKAEYTLSYTPENGAIAGLHLIGNPFTHNIYKGTNTAIESNYLEDGFYTLLEDGNWQAGNDNVDAIAPTQGILVQAISGADGHTLEITNTTAAAAKSGNDNIMFTVKNAKYSDVAYVLFKEGHGLNKIEHRNAEIPMLYVTKEGEDFAIADMADDTKVIYLGFEAKTMSQYTLSLKANGQYSYMHLYDKVAGEDIDMLVEDSYTFIGSPSDRKDRFMLNLTYDADIEEVEANTVFVYQNGNDIVVNGEGELHVFDMMGRMVMTTTVNGVETVSGLNNGIYVFRMGGKTQKVVVR